jgi:hypothetical protein
MWYAVPDGVQDAQRQHRPGVPRRRKRYVLLCDEALAFDLLAAFLPWLCVVQGRTVRSCATSIRARASGTFPRRLFHLLSHGPASCPLSSLPVCLSRVYRYRQALAQSASQWTNTFTVGANLV